MTWLSLQCARDANQQSMYEINTKHWERKTSELNINDLLKTMHTLYNISEEKITQQTKENNELRKVLNENDAKRYHLIDQYQHSLQFIQQNLMEIEDWRSRSRFV